jgi:Fuc2NAc and GlcNAc transferase
VVKENSTRGDQSAMRSNVTLVGVAALGALVTSTVLTGVVRQLALRHGLLDFPNQRSSHSAPTPRGGGTAIAIVSGIALALLGSLGALESKLVTALLGGGVAVAMVGFLDDRRRLSATIRLAVHAAAALWALLLLGGLPAVQVGGHVVDFGWAGWVIGALGIIWVLNLFNFMDGIDGLAAGEAVFVAWAGAFLSIVAGAGAEASSAAIVVGAAALGFLVWNWAPARLFMGDTGSGYLGYVLAVIAIAGARDNPTALLSWLILGGVFFTDATVTLLHRLLRRERVFEAHRSHAYQRLARRWHSHSRVAAAVLTIDFCWLLPCALFATKHPVLAGWAVVVALAPLVLLAFLTGAGRAER